MLEVRHTHTDVLHLLSIRRLTKDEQFGFLMTSKYFGELLMGNNDIGGICM